MIDFINAVIDWTNTNSGFVSILIFIATIVYGWLSGFFAVITRKSSLKVNFLPEGTMCSVVPTGKNTRGHDCFRFACSLYLELTNTGYRTIILDDYKLSYLAINNSKPVLIEHLTVCKSDFLVDLGNGDVKVLPFLVQTSYLSASSSNDTLLSGYKKTGIIYFESPEYYGNYSPLVDEESCVEITLNLTDTLGKKYQYKNLISCIKLIKAQKTCKKFGMTYNDLINKEQ